MQDTISIWFNRAVLAGINSIKMKPMLLLKDNYVASFITGKYSDRY